MSDDLVDKDKFDALLSFLIASPPTSLEAVKAVPKLKKDRTPKRSSVQKNGRLDATCCMAGGRTSLAGLILSKPIRVRLEARG